jgi:uncharacterized membrane protein YeaQ/YmgE (transglycosylase-associated protein family)
MLHILWEAIIGLIVGALAKFIMPGKDPGGIFITMLIGVAGSLLATFIGSHVGLYKEGQSAGFIMSLVGAIILLAIYRLFKGKSSATA